jgi:hypothetical protein
MQVIQGGGDVTKIVPCRGGGGLPIYKDMQSEREQSFQYPIRKRESSEYKKNHLDQLGKPLKCRGGEPFIYRL